MFDYALSGLKKLCPSCRWAAPIANRLCPCGAVENCVLIADGLHPSLTNYAPAGLLKIVCPYSDALRPLIIDIALSGLKKLCVLIPMGSAHR
jgi:hypothetical protein